MVVFKSLFIKGNSVWFSLSLCLSKVIVYGCF